MQLAQPLWFPKEIFCRWCKLNLGPLEAVNCEDPSLDNVCHLSATCSGFINPKRTTKACLLSTPIWHCHLHSTLTANGLSSIQPDTFPTPSSLNSLLNHGMSLADAKKSRQKCAKCFAVLCSKTVPVRCNVCKKGFHQKCSNGLKASSCYDQWKCEKCTKLQQNRLAASANSQLPSPANSIPS